MKGFVIGAVAMVVSVFSIAVLASGKADTASTIAAFCSNHGDLGLSHGGCVAFFTNRNLVPHDASVCLHDDMQRLLGAANHGQCVKKLGDMVPR